MNCKNCGNQVGEGMKFCPECGADMLGQSAEALTGKVVDENGYAVGDGGTQPNQNTAVNENVETLDNPKEIKGKLNIGHIGVLAGSILAMVSVFIKNSGTWTGESIIMLISSSNVNNGDGKTYIMILAALLIATIVLGFFRKNLIMLITSLVSMGWIIYTYKKCGQSFLNGIGLLLFLAGGILLVVSSIAAFQISRSQKA